METIKVKQKILRMENDPIVEILKEKEFATMGWRVKRGKIGYATEKIEGEDKISELHKKNCHNGFPLDLED